MAENYHKKVIAGLKDKSLFIQEAFIDGKWAVRDNKFDVFEPSTAIVLGQVANCTLKDFQTAIRSTDAAQISYFDTITGASRGALLRKCTIWSLPTKRTVHVAKILSLENGKTFAEALGEVIYSAGCSIVIKPPSETPYSALAFTKLAVDASLPPATIQVLPTRDRQAASELAINHLIKKISFTSSTGVGKYLTKLAAGTLKKVSLELGGNAPFIIFEDADLDLAAEGAMFCKF